jgi:APA family basic amino acid/polyamine antiporter
MAMDGVLPKVFAEVDEEGNLKAGTKIAGAIMITIATLVPFAYLDDLISSGILVAFTITDASVILVRRTSPHESPHLLENLLVAFNLFSLLTGFLLRNCLSLGVTGQAVRFLTVVSCLCTLFVGNRIRSHCPSKKTLMQWHSNEPNAGLFLTPFVPVLPLCGCFVNLYLISQLEMTGLVAIFGYIGLAILLYMWQRRKHHSGVVGEHHTLEPPERMLSLPVQK